MVKPVFLHIPKTGGTALKNYKVDNPDCNYFICNSHEHTIDRTGKHTAIILRDPLERFCSGFWSRKTFHLRQALAENSNYERYARDGKIDYSTFEKSILSKCSEPDDLLTLLQQDSTLSYNLSLSQCPLEVLTRSLVYWLGWLGDFKLKEHNVHMAFDLSSLSSIMLREFAVDLSYQDDFTKRSKTQFGFEQSYHVSNANAEWFVNSYRAADYALINYIKERPYYIS
jgi:hypothetical protein